MIATDTVHAEAHSVIHFVGTEASESHTVFLNDRRIIWSIYFSAYSQNNTLNCFFLDLPICLRTSIIVLRFVIPVL